MRTGWAGDALTGVVGGSRTMAVAILSLERSSSGRFWPDRRCAVCLLGPSISRQDAYFPLLHVLPPITARAVSSIGAFRPLARVPAKARYPNPQLPLRFGSGNASSCPIPAVRMTENSLDVAVNTSQRMAGRDGGGPSNEVRNASRRRRRRLIALGSNLDWVRRQGFVGGLDRIVRQRCRLRRQDLKRPFQVVWRRRGETSARS